MKYQSRLLVITACALLATAAAAIYWLWWSSPNRGLPYRSAFDQQKATDWTAFGGTWSVHDDIMRNSSDQRGAKLLTGSTHWRDYVLEADLRFLGSGGDVGLIVRTNDEEAGVDAYNGYYVGLRGYDDALIAGRAAFGWSEALPVPGPGVIQPLKWFHLKIVARGCSISASARNLETGQTSYVAMKETNCVTSGRVGLRSLDTGGEWRNVTVTQATAADELELTSQAQSIEPPLYPRTEAEYNTRPSMMRVPQLATVPGLHRSVTIESLRSIDRSKSSHVNVRGVVTLVRPELFVQDATGGAAVQVDDDAASRLNLGDEVEVTGTIEPEPDDHISTVSIKHAQVSLLWDRVPVSPVEIDALEGTTAESAGMLVEMQAEVIAQREKAGKIIFDLGSGTQAFRAIVDKPGGGLRVPALLPHSTVRVRGICVPDERYTRRMTPFVLLLRSTDDIDQVAGAPWWSARHLLQELVFTLFLLLLAQAYHGYMQRRRRAAITGERERLAHELHDTLAQTFAGLAFQLHGIRNRLRLRERAPFDMVEQQLEEASDFVRRTHQEASLSIAMLRSQSPEIGDLASALERSARELTPAGVARVRIVGDSTSYEMPLRITDALFHIAREALVNAARHANAQKIDITITFQRNAVLLEVADDGIGFVPDPHSQRLGLKGIRHRAAGIHATVQLDTKPGQGTRLLVSAPTSRRVWLFPRSNQTHR